MSLGKELLDTFESDIMVLAHPGMGEMLKAVQVKQKFGVAICPNAAHKKLMMKNLSDFVKSSNMVSFVDAPPKPASLIAFEKQLAGKAQQPETTPLSTSPFKTPPMSQVAQVLTMPTMASPGAKPAPLAGSPQEQGQPAMPSSGGTDAAANALAAFGTSLLRMGMNGPGLFLPSCISAAPAGHANPSNK